MKKKNLKKKKKTELNCQDAQNNDLNSHIKSNYQT